jgi:hypothetical protein
MITNLLLVVQLAIGTVLLLASLGKWRDPVDFARGVTDYEVLPDWLAYVFGLLLIPLETLIAVSHLTGWWISAAVLTGLAMFATFAVAIAINLARGRSLPCYCFGDGEGEAISAQALARVLLLLGGEGLLLAFPGKPGTSRLVYHQIASLSQFGFALFWTAILLVSGMWILGLPDLLELMRSHSSAGKRQRQGAGALP